MKTIQIGKIQMTSLLILAIFVSGCSQGAVEKKSEVQQSDISVLEKEIESRLREYELHLKNGDSIALGNMYMANAEIIPSTAGRENIVKVFSSMIQDSITGSSFETTELWGNDDLLVEEGTGSWSHENGTVVGRGRYLLVWKKEDGQWRILRDTWFPDKKK
jgi:ketosteroid isomerase-like protein